MAKTATDPGYAACPIRNIVDRFGDKWSLLVLYNLHTGGRLRFSEIHRRMTDISQKMLASTLRRLEQDGLLSRTVYPRSAAARRIRPHAPRRIAHAPSRLAHRLGAGKFRRDHQRPQLPASNRSGFINHEPETAKQQVSDNRGPRNSARPIVALSDATAIGSCNRPGQTSVPAPTNTSDKCTRQIRSANAPGKCARQTHPANAPGGAMSAPNRKSPFRDFFYFTFSKT